MNYLHSNIHGGSYRYSCRLVCAWLCVCHRPVRTLRGRCPSDSAKAGVGTGLVLGGLVMPVFLFYRKQQIHSGLPDPRNRSIIGMRAR